MSFSRRLRQVEADKPRGKQMKKCQVIPEIYLEQPQE